MKCLRCDETKFIEKEMEFNPEIKGEVLKVRAPCMICKNCQMQLMTTKQMGILRRVAVDKYREKNDLLTSDQITFNIKNLEMSPVEYTEYVGMQTEDIKRWKSYYVESKEQDELMKKAPNSSRSNTMKN